MAIQRKDEILGKALAGDATVIPRYDVIAPNGSKVAEDAQLVLKNPVLQQGMPFSAPLMNEVLAASGTTAGTASALTLAQTGFVLTDGATVRIKLHVDSGATPTLNINGTGAKRVETAQSRDVFGYFNGKAGVWYELIYSSAQNAYLYNAARITDTLATTLGLDPATATVAQGMEKLYDSALYRKIRNVTDVSAQNSVSIDLSDIIAANWREILIVGELFADAGAGDTGANTTATVLFQSYSCKGVAVDCVNQNYASVNGVISSLGGTPRACKRRFSLSFAPSWARNGFGAGASPIYLMGNFRSLYSVGYRDNIFQAMSGGLYANANVPLPPLVVTAGISTHYVGIANVQLWGIPQ